MALRISSLLFCVLAGGWLQACHKAVVAQASPEPGVVDELHSVERQLQADLAQAQHCELDSECAALPLGHRACGGPDRYVSYAPLSPSAKRVEQLAARHRHLSAQQQSGRMGICVVAPIPVVQCVRQRCVASDDLQAR